MTEETKPAEAETTEPTEETQGPGPEPVEDQKPPLTREQLAMCKEWLANELRRDIELTKGVALQRRADGHGFYASAYLHGMISFELIGYMTSEELDELGAFLRGAHDLTDAPVPTR